MKSSARVFPTSEPLEKKAADSFEEIGQIPAISALLPFRMGISPKRISSCSAVSSLAGAVKNIHQTLTDVDFDECPALCLWKISEGVVSSFECAAILGVCIPLPRDAPPFSATTQHFRQTFLFRSTHQLEPVKPGTT